MSSGPSVSNSTPRRAASSEAISQSGRQVPAAVTCWDTVVTRPSRLVIVPESSANAVAGNTICARRDDSVRNRSTAMTVRAPMSARSARLRSGKSAMGSAPNRMSVSILPSAAARRIPWASSPSKSGCVAQASSRRSPASPRRTRPGSSPGAMPMSSAPCTLPRLSADRNRAAGRAGADGGDGVDDAGGRLGDGGPSDHDREVVAGGGDQRRGIGGSASSDCCPVLSNEPTTAPASPGR